MKRVLLVAFAYPPMTDSGAVRAAGLAKYLPSFGWEPLVVTPRTPPGERPAAAVLETDYRDVLGELKARFRLDPNRGLHQQLKLPQAVRPGAPAPHTRVIGCIKSLITYPDPTKGWIPFATQAVTEAAGRNSIDAILTTAPPISAHLIGYKLKRALRVPWIADARDLWIGPENQSSAIHLPMRWLEKKTLSHADGLVTVSEPWANFLRNRHRRVPVFSILNGFDPAELASGSQSLTPCFSITYTGILYQGRRDPTLLFEALQELLAERVIPREELRVRFYCPIEPWLTALVERYGLQDVVELHGVISRAEALKKQKESRLLLLLGMSVASDSGCYPAKVFEYLAARRPILALGGLKGTVTQLMEETQAGAHLFGKPELRACLAEAYRQYREKGDVAYRAKQAAVEQYTQVAMAGRFATLLDSLSDGRVTLPLEDAAVASS